MLLSSVVIAATLLSQAAAGTFFRLEVGPPVAAGTGMKLKNAMFAVRSRLCEDDASVQITGSAEGLVNGARQSVPLKLTPASTAGVFVVSQQWPAEGQWVVHLTGTCPATRTVTTALVPVTKTSFLRDKIQLMPQAATAAQVDAVVREFARTRS